MNLLLRYDEAVIPIEKFTKHCLSSAAQPNKAIAFELALGYNVTNADILIADIRRNLSFCPAKSRGDNGYGMRYEVIMMLTELNGKSAKVLTSWIDDYQSGEMRLTSAYVDKRKGGQYDYYERWSGKITYKRT